MNIIKRLLFLSCLLSVVMTQAQPGSTTEAEVNIQATFIEANREKILENFEEAIELYQQVLKKSPNNASVLYELSRVYDVQDEDELALQSIKKAVAQDGENIWYRMFLADVYQKMEQHEKAAEVYEKLAQSDPDEEYYHIKNAYFLVLAGEYDDALKVYNTVEKKFGLNEDLIRRKHTLYVGLGDSKKAAKELQKLIDFDPENMEYRHLLASFYEQVGEPETARSIYKEIIKLDAQDTKAQLALAGEIKKNDDVTYLNTLKPVFSKSDESIDVKIKALVPYIIKVSETKEPALVQATLELSDMLCTVHPDEAKAYAIHGDLQFHAGQIDEALATYQKTLELDDNVFSVWDQIMYIYSLKRDNDSLLKMSEKAIDLFPNQASAFFMNGLASSNKGEYMNAVDSYQQAALMSRKNPDLKLDTHTKMALSYIALSKKDAAQKQLDKAKTMRATDPRVLDAEAMLLSFQGKHKEAKSILDGLMKKGGNTIPLILEHYGDIHAQLGKEAEAAKYWQQAKDKGGFSDALEQKIRSGKLP